MKFGICNEIFKEWNDIDRAIAYVKEVGYDGIEIAPFTLAQYVTDIPSAARRAIRDACRSKALDVIGIHWVLVGPEGMHINSPDAEVRHRTANYLAELVHFCADIGGKLVVFGSPKQRYVAEGIPYEEAFDYAVESFTQVLPVCEERDVTICMEPLTPLETNFCTTARETQRLVERVGHPRFRLMLDTKAMAVEPEGRPATIRRYGRSLAHYHANDDNLNGPGWGDVDFGPIFETLRGVGFDGYVSVEVFNFEPGPEAIAKKSLEYMRRFI
jgi:sugar phosphate isomerase/epimerase